MKARTRTGISFVLVAAVAAVAGPAFAGGQREPESSAGGVLVAAAENFYGNVVTQIAGSRATVVSILSNPDVDPHQYEPSVQDSIAAASARIVVSNGGGYDTWMEKLLSASPRNDRIVIKGFDIAPIKLPKNPHIWYSPENMSAIAQAIEGALERVMPAESPEFQENLKAFDRSLSAVRAKMQEIKRRYAGAPIGLTETIYLYQTGPMGLDVVTPLDFQRAIAEGSDPPADAMVAALRQITDRRVEVLIYNEQAVSPVVTKLLNAAKSAGVPVLAVTETMPQGKDYQSWMLDQLDALEGDLAEYK